MGQLLTTIVLAAAILFGCAGPKSDERIYQSVVQLATEKGNFCSGEQVKAPSGEVYVLTAAHCQDPIREGKAYVVTASGKRYRARIIAEDPNSDLLLLKGVKGLPALDIADKVELRQEIRTFTGGLGMRPYRTSGQTIQYRTEEIPLFAIDNKKDSDRCHSMKKYTIVDLLFFQACALKTSQLFTTAFVAPGSSGGAVVDARGDLVGVVSASGGGFSLFVRLSDIKRFLANR